MATAPSVTLSEIQRDTLKQVCDTFVPAVDVPDDPSGFFARPASALMIPEAIEQQLASGAVPEEQLDGLRQLLDGLAAQGFNEAPLAAREQMLHGFMDADPGALAGLSAFKGLTLMLFYGAPDNPNWEAIGYPGPRARPPSAEEAPKTISVTRPSAADLTLTADVVVVGSGSGGGVVAGELATAGKDVVVLEAGGYYNEADFNQLELWAYEKLYRAGGVAQTANGSLVLMTGSNLGGGSTVNWTNCLRTTDWVRDEWEHEHGLEGLAGLDYDAHLDAVWDRLQVNDSCSDFNGPSLRMKEGCEKLGWDFRTITRNADRDRYDADLAGLMGFGDVTGAKLGTLKTYLQDAADAGARFVVNCNVDRVLVENGRAAGVAGTYLDDEGRRASVVVRAQTVVLAAGALDTPAVLLRSGIGGPAAGDYLRLHPASAMPAVYDEPQKAWWGAPQTALSAQFANVEDGYGFLIETAHASPAVTGSSVPWVTGQQHKEYMAQAPVTSSLVMLIRDRGHGRVTIDAAGNPVHSYDLADAIDIKNFRRALAEIARLNEAAGAQEIYTLHRKLTRWSRATGEDIEVFAKRAHDGALDPYEHATFSLHHRRMGNDPATSVADPWGQLHDTPGVWIGDASAFPSASGTNPMITTMALAHRTAANILR
jgi:choline dehydrogenase-like flavoprotein